MTLQRRHFELIADAIKTAPVDFETQKKLARHFADRLEATNEKFNRATFTRAATGVILL